MSNLDLAVANFKRVCEPSLTRFTIKTIFPSDNNEYSERWLTLFAARNRGLVIKPSITNGVLTCFTENVDKFCDKFRDFNEQCHNIYTCRG